MLLRQLYSGIGTKSSQYSIIQAVHQTTGFGLFQGIDEATTASPGESQQRKQSLIP